MVFDCQAKLVPIPLGSVMMEPFGPDPTRGFRMRAIARPESSPGRHGTIAELQGVDGREIGELTRFVPVFRRGIGRTLVCDQPRKRSARGQTRVVELVGFAAGHLLDGVAQREARRRDGTGVPFAIRGLPWWTS